MALIKPYVETVLNDVLIPSMLATHEEVTLFTEDPIEMIRRGEDVASP